MEEDERQSQATPSPDPWRDSGEVEMKIGSRLPGEIEMSDVIQALLGGVGIVYLLCRIGRLGRSVIEGYRFVTSERAADHGSRSPGPQIPLCEGDALTRVRE